MRVARLGEPAVVFAREMRAYRSIVVGVELSAASAHTAAVAVRVAEHFDAQRLHLVHVVHTSPVLPAPLRPDGAPDPITAAAVTRAERKLDELDLPETEVWIHREVRTGSPARELARAADEHHADLVVVARRGHNAFTRLVLGSVPNGLIRVTHCPVLVVDAGLPADARFSNVLAAVDLSPVSHSVLENAAVVARAYAGEVQVLSLFEPPVLDADGGDEENDEAHRRHQEALGALLGRVRTEGVPLESQVVGHRGPVPPTIVELARGSAAEVIVLGTSGRNAWHRMILGSTAQHVLLRAPCAVLVVPSAIREESEDPSEAPLPGDPVLGGNSPC